MLLSETSKARARALSAVAAGMSVAIALTAYFGLNDGGWTLLPPVVAAIAATAWPTRTVVATALLATAAVVVMGLDDTGVLFGGSAAALMLALNHLQDAATRLKRR